MPKYLNQQVIVPVIREGETIAPNALRRTSEGRTICNVGTVDLEVEDPYTTNEADYVAGQSDLAYVERGLVSPGADIQKKVFYGVTPNAVDGNTSVLFYIPEEYDLVGHTVLVYWPAQEAWVPPQTNITPGSLDGYQATISEGAVSNGQKLCRLYLTGLETDLREQEVRVTADLFRRGAPLDTEFLVTPTVLTEVTGTSTVEDFAPATVQYSVVPEGPATVRWSVTTNQPTWMTFDVESGTTLGGLTSNVITTLDQTTLSNLSAGTYNATVTFSALGYEDLNRTIRIVVS